MTQSLRTLVERKEIEGVTKLTGFSVDPNAVQIEEGWNGRQEGPRLTEYRQRLKAAMKAGAFIPPIDVEIVDGQMIVREGHQRTLMARELIVEGTPYLLQARQIQGNDAAMRYHMLGTGSGLTLDPLEAGLQYLTLTRMGETVAQIADRLGHHRSTIENGIALAQMPAAVQKMVGAGTVAPHTALKTVKAHGKEAAKVLNAAAATVKPGKKVTPKALPKAGKVPSATNKTLATAAQVVTTGSDGQQEAVTNPPDLQRRQWEAPTGAVWLGAHQAPVADVAALVERLSCINTLVSTLPRDLIAELVKEAKRLMGQAS